MATGSGIAGYVAVTGLYIFGMVKDDFSKGQVYISFHVQGQNAPTEEGVVLYTKGNCAVISNNGGTIAVDNYTEGEVYYGFKIKLA